MDYSLIPFEELERMLIEKRGAILDGSAPRGSISEVYALRREIDRRKGDNPAPLPIDFEGYITD